MKSRCRSFIVMIMLTLKLFQPKLWYSSRGGMGEWRRWKGHLVGGEERSSAIAESV